MRPRAIAPPSLKNKFEPSFTTMRLASVTRSRMPKILVHHRPDAFEFLDVVLNLRAVFRVRGMLEVMFEVPACAVKLPELQSKKAAVAELHKVFGIDHQHHVYDRKAFVDGVTFQVNV